MKKENNNSTSTFYYSIVQFCPDRSKRECANVGMVLFNENKMSFLMSGDADRVVGILGRYYKIDENYVMNCIENFIERISNEEPRTHTWNKFCATLANEIVCTEPMPIRIDDGYGIEELYGEIFVK